MLNKGTKGYLIIIIGPVGRAYYGNLNNTQSLCIVKMDLLPQFIRLTSLLRRLRRSWTVCIFHPVQTIFLHPKPRIIRCYPVQMTIRRHPVKRSIRHLSSLSRWRLSCSVRDVGTI